LFAFPLKRPSGSGAAPYTELFFQIVGRQIVASGNDAKTGPIQNDYGDMMAMFNWDGTLEVQLEDSILTIKGVLRPVKR
jgi:hypothetical protein